MEELFARLFAHLDAGGSWSGGDSEYLMGHCVSYFWRAEKRGDHYWLSWKSFAGGNGSEGEALFTAVQLKAKLQEVILLGGLRSNLEGISPCEKNR